jgi:soluble lytic murein transglycosylase-like protein
LIALAGFLLVTTSVLAQPAVSQLPAPASSPPATVTPAQLTVLSAGDVALYKEIMAAERNGDAVRAGRLSAKLGDPSLMGYAEAQRFLTAPPKRVTVKPLVAWLGQNRELAVADRIYRLAVARSTRTIRRHRKTITVAVVTNIPAPVGVGKRTGGYEDLELPEPWPSEASARGVMSGILAAIKDGQPDQALALMQSVQAGPADMAVLAHRIASSYRAEGRDSDAYKLSTSITDPGALLNVPQLMWDAGFAAYRLGDWANAEAWLEKLAETPNAQNSLRAQGAFWAARAHMQSGDPLKVVTLLNFAAGKEPSFYGLIAEQMLGIDTQTGFSDAVLNEADFHDLMAVPAARRAVALWQIGEKEFVGPELNRAFVNNNERLDPGMAALARAIGVPNIELRASEASAARGLVFTGLFPVPPYNPDGGYQIDSSLVLAFARIESRFQTQATSSVGARGLMQLMPATAARLGVSDPDTLYEAGTSLAVGQRYIVQLLNRLDGNLVELGGAYNAGPGAVDRWRTTKAGGNDPLLFVESIPVAETRSYVKRLLLYHWLYRRRFGQDAKSLQETAAGQWPTYHPPVSVSGSPDGYGLKISAQ